MEKVNSKTEETLTCALGQAAVQIWSRLPPGVQHDLFEEVIAGLGEAMRQPLAVYLHGRHVRTSGSSRRDMLEPDSLGG